MVTPFPIDALYMRDLCISFLRYDLLRQVGLCGVTSSILQYFKFINYKFLHYFMEKRHCLEMG